MACTLIVKICFDLQLGLPDNSRLHQGLFTSKAYKLVYIHKHKEYIRQGNKPGITYYTLSEWITRIYLHEFTNNEQKISLLHEALTSVVLKISSSLLVNQYR